MIQNTSSVSQQNLWLVFQSRIGVNRFPICHHKYHLSWDTYLFVVLKLSSSLHVEIDV